MLSTLVPALVIVAADSVQLNALPEQLALQIHATHGVISAFKLIVSNFIISLWPISIQRTPISQDSKSRFQYDSRSNGSSGMKLRPWKLSSTSYN